MWPELFPAMSREPCAGHTASVISSLGRRRQPPSPRCPNNMIGHMFQTKHALDHACIHSHRVLAVEESAGFAPSRGLEFEYVFVCPDLCACGALRERKCGLEVVAQTAVLLLINVIHEHAFCRKILCHVEPLSLTPALCLGNLGFRILKISSLSK